MPTQTEISQQATTRVHSGNTGNRMALGHKAFYAEEEANTIQLVMQKAKCQHKPKHHNSRQGYIQETQDGSSSSSQTSYTLRLNSTKENFPHKTFKVMLTVTYTGDNNIHTNTYHIHTQTLTTHTHIHTHTDPHCTSTVMATIL